MRGLSSRPSAGWLMSCSIFWVLAALLGHLNSISSFTKALASERSMCCLHARLRLVLCSRWLPGFNIFHILWCRILPALNPKFTLERTTQAKKWWCDLCKRRPPGFWFRIPSNSRASMHQFFCLTLMYAYVYILIMTHGYMYIIYICVCVQTYLSEHIYIYSEILILSNQMCFPWENLVINAAQDASAWPSLSPQCIAERLGSHENLWPMDRAATMELLVSNHNATTCQYSFFKSQSSPEKMWSLGRKLPETFGFHVQSDQPSDLHCLSQTNNSYTRNKWSCLLYMPGLGWLPWKSEVYPTRAAPAAWNSCYVSVCGGNFQDGWWHSGSAENKIDLHCMRCMLPVSIWSHWLVWKTHGNQGFGAILGGGEKHTLVSKPPCSIRNPAQVWIQSIRLSFLIAGNLEQIRTHAATSRELYLWDCTEMAPKASDLCLHFILIIFGRQKKGLNG